MRSKNTKDEEAVEKPPVVYRTYMAGDRVVRCEMPPLQAFVVVEELSSMTIELETLPMMEFVCGSAREVYELTNIINRYIDHQMGHKIEVSARRRGEWGDYVQRHYVTIHADEKNLKSIQAYFRLLNNELPRIVR